MENRPNKDSQGGYSRPDSSGGYNRGGYERRDGQGGERGSYNSNRGGYERKEGQSGEGGGYNRGGYERRDSQGGRYQGGGRPYDSRKPKVSGGFKPSRQKTETQDFIMFGEEKIQTHFPVPVNVEFPLFQRAIGMAEGTILEANEKGNGIVEIEGVKYPLKENRIPSIQKRYPLSKYVGKLIKFSFYPTITVKGMKILKLNPDSQPFIKISNFRRELPKQGAIEVIGMIKETRFDYFVVAIWSAISKKEYIVNVFGKCTAKIGDFVWVDCTLRDGLIKADTIKVLEIKK